VAAYWYRGKPAEVVSLRAAKIGKFFLRAFPTSSVISDLESIVLKAYNMFIQNGLLEICGAVITPQTDLVGD